MMFGNSPPRLLAVCTSFFFSLLSASLYYYISNQSTYLRSVQLSNHIILI